MELIKEIGAFAGLVAFLGLALLALLAFTQGRDIRRLREWAGSAPERDTERKEATSAAAGRRAEEMRKLQEAREAEQRAADLREERRKRRAAGLPELTLTERLSGSFQRRGALLGDPRYLIAAFIVVLAVGGGIAYAALHGVGGGHGGGAEGAPRAGQIEVTVLNGTSVPGLAAHYGGIVQRKGFRLGAVTNSSSSYSESIVMYRHGNIGAARRVAKALRIGKLEAMSSSIASVAGGAPVAVVVGQENASPTG